MNKAMVIGLSVLLCLCLAFGLMWSTPWKEEAVCTTDYGAIIHWGECGEPVAVYMIAFRNADMKIWFLDNRTSYETRKECQRVAMPDRRCVALLGNLPPNVVSDRP
jgi:hypothetical protein